nr:PRC-barrel domain-containing protein [Desulfopila inferna]
MPLQPITLLYGRYAVEKLLVSTLALLLCIAPTSPLKGMENAENSSGMAYPSGSMPDQKSKYSLKAEGTYVTIAKFDGLPVLSRSGEEIGKMQNIVTDKESGLIHYFTLTQSSDSRDQIAVPYGVVRFYSDRAILSVDRDKLDSAPQQDDLSDAEFQKNLESHYGISPAW